MKDGGDVFGVLGWGLRKYFWVVALCVVALGLVVPQVLDRAPEQYQAEAQVGPTQALKLPNLDPLPRIGETVFMNGEVAAAVRQSFAPPLPPQTRVIPDRVELVAAQDNIVFTVVGHGATPANAERIANVAAARFTQELNKYAESVGSFAIQRLATPPANPEARVAGPLSQAIGVLAGLAAGVGAVALLLVWRRPVVDAAGAELTTGVPVFGRVLLAGSRDGTRGLPQLCRRVMAGSTDTLLLAGPHNTRRERRVLAAELTRVLGWTRNVVSLSPRDSVNRSRSQPTPKDPMGRPDFLIVDGPSQLEVATRRDTSVTLLVVREGIAQTTLRRLAEQYLDDGSAGVVLVHGPRWRTGTRRERAAARPEHGSGPSKPRRWSPDDHPTVFPARD